MVFVMASLTAFSKDGVSEESAPYYATTERPSWVSITENGDDGFYVDKISSVSPDGNWSTSGPHCTENGCGYHTITNLKNGISKTMNNSLGEICGVSWAPDSSRFAMIDSTNDLIVHVLSSGEEISGRLSVHWADFCDTKETPHPTDSDVQECTKPDYESEYSCIVFGKTSIFILDNFSVVVGDDLYNRETIYRCITTITPNEYAVETFYCRTEYLDIEFELIGFSSETGNIIGVSPDGDLVLINDKVYHYSTAPETVSSVWVSPSNDLFKIDRNGIVGIDADHDGRADYWDYDTDGVVSKTDLCPSTPINHVADDLGCSWGQQDGDEDGIRNDMDDFPEDACAFIDTDGDGKPNNILSNCETSLVLDLDDDNDGHEDRKDDCPTQGSSLLPDWIDTDYDGLCNEQDLDDDGDGYTDSDELYDCGAIYDHLDPGVTPIDTDSDGECDIKDEDDDGDGYSDWHELNDCGAIYDHLDPDVTPIDTDSDGYCDHYDWDDDGDGWSDWAEEEDCFTDPLDSSSIPKDTDGDRRCDYLDWDDDNDGYDDEEDDYPLDPDKHSGFWEGVEDGCCGLVGCFGLLFIAAFFLE